MTVRFATPRDPQHWPEFLVWRMTKDARAVEARVRIVPSGDGVPEFRLLMTGSDGTLELLWSLQRRDGRDVNALAQEKQREFEVRGWRSNRVHYHRWASLSAAAGSIA